MTPIEIVEKHFGKDNLTEAQKIEIRDISDELANIIIRNYCSRNTSTYGDS